MLGVHTFPGILMAQEEINWGTCIPGDNLSLEPGEAFPGVSQAQTRAGGSFPVTPWGCPSPTRAFCSLVLCKPGSPLAHLEPYY
jgi:hypothetical protein